MERQRHPLQQDCLTGTDCLYSLGSPFSRVGMELEYDVVIIGGAFSGAATALMLKREQPKARVLIIEKTAAFDRKVGESTTEVSSCYMTRILGLAHYLGPAGHGFDYFLLATLVAETALAAITARFRSLCRQIGEDVRTLDELLSRADFSTN